MRELGSVWGPYLQDFLDFKKRCGFKYTSSESVIYQFDRYYLSSGINDLRFSRDVIEPFLYLKKESKIATQIWKASVLRQFGAYLIKHDIIDNIYLIPSISLKGEAEFVPYIFSNEELNKIVKYLDTYQSKGNSGTFNLKINTLNAVSTAIKILMATGMRAGEVLSLTKEDIDFEERLFTIKEAKNHNERIIPFSFTIRSEIENYILNTPFKINNDDLLFQIDIGSRLRENTCWLFFKKALKSIGGNITKGRLHDLRHTYAVMALTQLQKSEENVNLALSYLSDYLGHKSLSETQKYIWMTPGLFENTKSKMSDYTSFIKSIYDGEKYDD